MGKTGPRERKDEAGIPAWAECRAGIFVSGPRGWLRGVTDLQLHGQFRPEAGGAVVLVLWSCGKMAFYWNVWLRGDWRWTPKVAFKLFYKRN